MGRSLFDILRLRGALSAAGAARRIGVVDIGSNSVRLVVFDGATRAPSVFFNEKVLCGLGEEMAVTGRLSADGKRRALAAASRFKALTDGMNLGALAPVATAALRDSEDGPSFAKELGAALGQPVAIASGPDEARLSAQGVLLGSPGAAGLVADLGGSSMELIEIAPDGPVRDGVTMRVGPLRLKSRRAALADAARGQKKDKAKDRLAAALVEEIDAEIEAALVSGAAVGDIAPMERLQGRTLYLVGGSWRALLKAHMARSKYPLKVLHGFTLSCDEARDAALWGAEQDPASFGKLIDVSDKRASVVPLAALALARLIERLEPYRVVLSAFGLREGVYWESMPAALRGVDPLIDACSALERHHGRAPGFGEELWAWLRPALQPSASAEELRLAEAVCLLADASWRTHPDYRSLTSFELVTRNNFGVVDHADRVFMGAALLHRYKGGRRALKDQRALRLLSEPRAKRAEAIGRGVRLGAMLSGAALGVLPQCPISRTSGGALSLKLAGPGASLDGEEVRKRLQAFAKALDVGSAIERPSAS